MKQKKKETAQEAPQRLSYVETPLSTGQYPAFGIDNPGKLPPAERQESKNGHT